jgi:hypothetical protein
MMFRTTLILTL